MSWFDLISRIDLFLENCRYFKSRPRFNCFLSGLHFVGTEQGIDGWARAQTGKSHWKKSVRSKESLQTRLLTTRPASPQSWFPYENPRGEEEAQSGPWIFHKQCIIAPSTSSCTNTWLQRYMFVGRSVPILPTYRKNRLRRFENL